jgi:hypothetical protein
MSVRLPQVCRDHLWERLSGDAPRRDLHESIGLEDQIHVSRTRYDPAAIGLGARGMFVAWPLASQPRYRDLAATTVVRDTGTGRPNVTASSRPRIGLREIRNLS